MSPFVAAKALRERADDSTDRDEVPHSPSSEGPDVRLGCGSSGRILV